MADQTFDPSQSNPQGGTPPAGGTPAGGTPAGGTPAGGTPTGGTPTGKDLSGIMEENVDISGLIANAGNQQQQQDFLAKVKVPPHPNTTFNEQEFIQLLAGSISLTINEKYKIVDAIPQLSQFQVDELMKIFREEQQKFAELEKKHAEQVAELEKQNAITPEDLQGKQEEKERAKKEQEEADALRKSLGINQDEQKAA